MVKIRTNQNVNAQGRQASKLNVCVRDSRIPASRLTHASDWHPDLHPDADADPGCCSRPGSDRRSASPEPMGMASPRGSVGMGGLTAGHTARGFLARGLAKQRRLFGRSSAYAPSGLSAAITAAN